MLVAHLRPPGKGRRTRSGGRAGGSTRGGGGGVGHGARAHVGQVGEEVELEEALVGLPQVVDEDERAVRPQPAQPREQILLIPPGQGYGYGYGYGQS